MSSNEVLIAAILSFIAFLVNSTVLILILSRGRHKYHYLFATTLAIFAIGNLSMFLFNIRNSHLDELTVYFSIVQASIFLSVPSIYHFTCSYLNQPRKKSTIFIWAFMVIVSIFSLFGMVTGFGPMEVIQANKGNYVALAGGIIDRINFSIIFSIVLIFIWLACWFLFRARRREKTPLARRHMQYILISFLVISFFFLTLLILPTEFEGSLLISPIRGLLSAVFGALIGLAIVKERLLDITVIIRKTTIYSLLLALVVIIFSLSEHMLATYVGKFFGEHSVFIHIISIVVVIAILMPVRQRVERAIERFFEKKKVEF
jgi:hypothetical protein